MAEIGEEDVLPNLFQEPKDFYKPEPPPTTATHRMRSGEELQLRLVGHNPLWGHYLWNAGRVNANHLEDHASDLIQGRDVLELGAGAGLPSLVCIEKGARSVVITDWPDQDLLDNLRLNVQTLQDRGHSTRDGTRGKVHVEGLKWGYPVESLLAHTEGGAGFDTIVLADLIFNHIRHEALIATVRSSLKRSSRSVVLVFYTSHRPWLAHKDLAFFDLVRASGFAVEKVVEEIMERPMFEVDRGDELTRRTVHGYEMRWLLSS